MKPATFWQCFLLTISFLKFNQRRWIYLWWNSGSFRDQGRPTKIKFSFYVKVHQVGSEYCQNLKILWTLTVAWPTDQNSQNSQFYRTIGYDSEIYNSLIFFFFFSFMPSTARHEFPSKVRNRNFPGDMHIWYVNMHCWKVTSVREQEVELCWLRLYGMEAVSTKRYIARGRPSSYPLHRSSELQ